MDKKRTGAIEPIRGFIERIRSSYRPSLMILFGSRARGEDLAESDYDIMIVSEKFRGTGWIRRHEEVYALWDKPAHLDIICYSPEEFESKKKQLGIARRALEEGIVC